MKNKFKNKIILEVNGYWDFDETKFDKLVRSIDIISKKYPNARIHIRLL